MSVTVKVNQHGHLVIRVRWRGQDESTLLWHRPACVAAGEAARKHRQYFASGILRYWRDVPLQEITVGALREFRAPLAQRTIPDRPISQKTICNIIDGHLRPLYRDVREELEEQGILLGAPFSRLRWQKTIRAKPDPFTPAERDRILAYFLEKKRFWHPLVHFLFYVGTRPSEAAALRIGDIDLDRATVSITKSRDASAEAVPKTEKPAARSSFCRTSWRFCERCSIHRMPARIRTSSATPTAVRSRRAGGRRRAGSRF